ncbi:MAG: M23 family metallopeptidase [Balneolaceae bacterium]|nr:MAG: M23 family metallopeptidase [Balneolaceae bacterium]
MFQLFKSLYNKRFKKLTLVLWVNTNPDKTETYGFRPIRLFRYFVISILFTVFLFGAILYFTPLGSLLFSKQDRLLRHAVNNVSERVYALQDSLALRDLQLMNIRDVLLNAVDTTFETGSSTYYEPLQSPGTFSLSLAADLPEFQSLSNIDIIYASSYGGSLQFPAMFPLNGTVTRSFDAGSRHYGIDIAAPLNSYIRAVADGAVIQAGWAVDFGYSLSVQHSDGYVSVYKHNGSIYKVKGDMVLQGDIIGKVGNTGFMSSGPHLHFELWRDGVPQNPARFFNNL